MSFELRIPVWKAILLILGAWIAFGDHNLPFNPLGPAAPFPATEPDAVVFEETTQRTPAIDASANAIKNAIEGAKGKFRRFDKDQTDFSLDEPWVATAVAAWKAKGAPVPGIVASNGRTGVNQALPTTSPEDAVKLLSGMGIK